MLTAERLRGLLHYDPETGLFAWRATSSNRAPIGAEAGSPSGKGYIDIRIDGRLYGAHRLAWLYVTGEWPTGQIDHRDTIKDHNWFDNLRPATGTQNKANVRRRSDNTSGFKGVSWHKQRRRWHARLRIRGQCLSLGYFDQPEKAHTAYIAAAQLHFGEFARAA